MRFLLDENAEFRLARFLQEQGHDVTAIAHDYPFALSDPEVLSIARAEHRILITSDRDFGELIHRLRLPHSGVIFFRLPAATVEIKIERLKRIPVVYADQLDAFLVVTEKRVRINRPR